MNKFLELFDPKKGEWKGIPTLVYFSLLAISLLLLYLPDSKGVVGGYLRDNFLINFAILGTLSIFFGVIGDIIPVWNKYVGGGTILVFFVSAFLATYGFLPEVFIGSVDVFYNESPVRFLELFIPALIVGSVLTVNREILLKAIVGYIPLIIIGVIGATIGGIAVGFIFGKAPADILMNYVLPVMGGGTGAGAIPMSEMYQEVTGTPSEEWFAFGISILTIANIIAIFTGAALNALGEKRPELTGNGELIISGKDSITAKKEEWESITPTNQNFTGALIFTGVMFAFSHMLSKLWSALGIDLHRLAVLVILMILINAFNLVPPVVKAGAKAMQQFFVKNTLWILMFAVGMSTNFQQILDAITLANVLIATAIVLGATVSIMAVSKFLKFYPIEAAITAGLCMANRGGSGDVAVLGAANRMELISFGQISSRIGGALMLIFASFIFGILA